MNSIDFIILIIFGIVVSIIIGFSIVSVIDNKINNVSINVPPIRLPQPTVVVRLERGDGDYDIYVDKNYDNTNNMNNVNLMRRTNIERFESVKQNDQNDSSVKLNNTPDAEFVGDQKSKKTSNNIEYPDHDNIVRYGQYTCYRTPIRDADLDAKQETELIINQNTDKNPNICQNEFVYKNNSYRVINRSDKIEGCEYLHNDNNDMDPGEYYKSKISVVKSYFEDPKMRGYNILLADDYAGIKEIGRIDLTNKFQHPSEFGTLAGRIM